MKEFIDKLIDRLEEAKVSANRRNAFDSEVSYACAIDIVNKLAEENNMGEISDGYHTFNELYHHRAVLFSVICNSNKEKAWKSKLHDTGDMYEGMFIVGIETPEGQTTYHYDINPYWDMFKVKELPKAPKWDGHTPNEAIRRIGLLAEEYKLFGNSEQVMDKLIERLEEYPTYSFGVSLLNTEEYIKVSDVKKIANNLAEEYKHCTLCYLGSPCEYQNENAILPNELLADENGWISVSERLPEEKHNPITYDYMQYPVMVNIGGTVDLRYYYYGNGHWRFGFQIMDKYVTHWMDIAPYTEGE